MFSQSHAGKLAMLIHRSLLLAVVLAPGALPALAAGGDFSGLVDIGGGPKMYLECRGTRSPTVFIVPGGKAAADDWTEDSPVFADVAKFTRVCSYDRPGTPLADGSPSRSDPVSMPITAGDSVADLHALVAAAGIEAPFVIVGHSYGGLIVRLYAMTYPADVDGMVLVDALSEGLRAAETPEEWAHQKIILDGDLTETLKIYPDIERADADPSFDQLLAAPLLQPMPLVVLSADHPWGPLVPGFIADGSLPPDTPPDIGYVHGPGPEAGAGRTRRGCAGLQAHHQHRQRARDPQGPAAARPRLDPRSRRSRARRQDKPGALTNSYQGRHFAF
jgi:pimeloyl-ACP methyl ester carboxylesterase